MNLVADLERPAVQGPVDQRPHAVIIGSGFGGLAAGIRLGARGYRVTMLERLGQPGGRARSIIQDGFTFDAGPTIITAPFLLEELWTLARARLSDDIDLKSLDPFYRIRFHDGAIFDYSADETAMMAEIAKFNAHDIAGYRAFLKKSAAIYEVGFEQLGDRPFQNFWDMLRIAPAMLRLEAYRSVYGLVAKYIKDERLRMVFSFHPLLIGGNPFQASAVYGLIHHLERRYGVHYVMGGTHKLVRAMVRLVERLGGTLRLNAEVAEIIVQGRHTTGVRLVSGENVRADLVISNADSAATYRHLLPEKLRPRWSNARLVRAKYSMGLFVWYFGTSRQYNDVLHHTILLGPRYKALLKDIFQRKILADDFSLYLHRPTASDPALAPKGCDAFYVLAPVPNLGGKTDWRKEAEPYRRRIAEFLERTMLPELSAHIVTSAMMTPLDFAEQYLSYQGAGFSFAPILSQSAWFRPHNRCDTIDNLYFVGAGTHPGAGVPGVISSAKLLDRLIVAVSHVVV